MKEYRFNHVVVAGTFDHLHAGHQFLLDGAFRLGKKVTVGITSDRFVQKKVFAQSLEPYITRLKSLHAYLKAKNYASRAHIFTLSDIYGSAVTDASMQAIVITNQTYENAVKVNQARKTKGLSRLTIVRLPLKKGIDRKTISSSRVRIGEIDRDGYVYRHLYKNSSKLYLPSHLREKMRIPAGQIYKGSESDLEKVAKEIKNYIKKMQPVLVIAVGDIIAYSLEKSGYTPDLSIIDLKTQRRQLKPWPSRQKMLAHTNKAGTVSRIPSDVIKKSILKILEKKEKIVLRIHGEEDLLTLTAILHTPLGSLVVYGQRDLGAIVVEVTEAQKAYTVSLLKQFSH